MFEPDFGKIKSPFGRNLEKMQALSPLGESIATTWSDCTSSNAKGSVSKVIFNPNPPISGGNTTIIVMGSVYEEVSDGSDICKSSTQVLPLNSGNLYCQAVPCPVSVGNVNVTLIAYISDSAPSGTIKTILNETDTSNNQLFCVKIDITIGYNE